jgi:hypothetical protein
LYVKWRVRAAFVVRQVGSECVRPAAPTATASRRSAVGHHVRREDHRRAPAALRENEIAHQPHVHRIKAEERLVENQQIGLVQNRRDELHFLQQQDKKSEELSKCR